MKKQLLLMFALLLGFISYAQTPVVYFPLNSNLAFQTPPTPPAGTLLTYHSSNGNTKTTTFESDWLRGTGAGDYLELSINATTLNNLAISFDAKFSSAIGNGTWNVYANTGTGNTFEPAGTITLRSLFGSTSNGNLIESLPPGADGKADLKIRIQVDFGWNLGDNLRINNLKLITGSPKIKVYSDTNEIPNNADAAVSYNTVFGEFQTLLEPGESKTYRVRNWNGEIGSTLSVNNIEIIPASGTSANDFVVASTNNVNVLPRVNAFQYCSDPRWWGCNQYSDTEYGEITIKFVPQGEGVRSAIVKVSSNGTPSPYFFTVIGGGKSCEVSNTPYVINTADNEVQTLRSSDLTAADFVGGNTTTNIPNGSLTSFYPRPNSGTYNLYTSASTSWYTKDVEKIKTFGGAAGIDISNLKNVSVEFNVAAFANSTSNGVNNNDYIILSVTDKDGNWFDVMRLNGSNDSRSPRKYAFNPIGRVFSKDYNLSLTIESNYSDNTSASGSGTSRARASFKFNIPLQYSKDLKNFKFKIRAKANANAVWLIDDISIKSNNANFKTWNGYAWTPAGRPGTKEKAIFNGDYNFTGAETANLEVCECEVNKDKTLTIPLNKTLTVQGNVINNGTAANFIVSSDANLIQKDPGANNEGNITVERNVTDMNNISTKMDYVYWSSPVSGQQTKGAGGFSPGTPNNYFFTYRESNDRFYETGDPTFVPGKGYAVRAETGINPDTGLAFTNPYAKDYKFKGVPNNGEISIPIKRSANTGSTIHGYNLIGNPYPSNIDFDVLYEANNTIIYNQAWFWTNTTFTADQQGQGYSGNNYRVYNATGGQIPAVNGIIKVGQGFIVQSQGSEGSTSTFNFKNNHLGTPMRVANPGTFYQKNTSAKNRFWLKLISPNDVDNTQLIGYIDGATDGFEMGYDAEAFGMSSNLFYSILEDKQLLIQGKSAQFSADDHINLGANFFRNSSYTIELEQPEGIFANGQIIYLKDKLTGTITDLSQGSYTFEANKGVTNGRFEIIYKTETVLVTDSKVKDAVVVYRDSDHFVIKSPKTIMNVEVYDISGKLITVIKANNTQATLNAAFFTKGMYLLRIKAIDGEIINKKIIKQ